MGLRLIKSKPEPEAPGLDGMLRFRTRVEAGALCHQGTARLVDMHEGTFLFIDLETGIEVCLHADEILEFVSRAGAS